MPSPRSPRREFLDALAKLLARAGALRPYSPDCRRWKKVVETEEMTSVIPDARDGWLLAEKLYGGGLPYSLRHQQSALASV